MSTHPNNPPLSQRQEILALADRLQTIKDSSPEVQAVLKLLALLFDEARDRLLVANPETFMPLQGEANAYRSLLKMLLTPRPSIPKE